MCKGMPHFRVCLKVHISSADTSFGGHYFFFRVKFIVLEGYALCYTVHAIRVKTGEA